MKKILALIAMSSATMLSADYNSGQQQQQLQPNQTQQQSQQRQQLQSSQPKQQYSSPQPQPLAYQQQHAVLDSDLAKSISAALTSDMWANNYQNVTFDVNNGVVTLRGYVYESSDKAKVAEKLNRIPGVAKLQDEVIVVGDRTTADNTPTPSTRSKSKDNPKDYAASESDKAINSNIRDVLSAASYADKFKDISLRTTVGIVTVNGYAASAADVTSLTDDIKKIDGVKSVINKVVVKKNW